MGNSASVTTSVSYIIIIDRWALVIYTILFFAYQIGTLIWMYFVPWRKWRMLFKKEKENRLHTASNYNNSKPVFVNVSSRAKKTAYNEENGLTIVSNVEL